MNQNVKLDKKKDSPAILVNSLSHDGRGIADINNKITFIRGALPNEIVTYRLQKKHTTYNEATLFELLKPSIERVQPPCQHFDTCGGCNLQHLDVDKQIAFKENTLINQLKHFGRVTPTSILTPLSAQTLGYRRKARLSVRYVVKKNQLILGFHEKSSANLTDLQQCIILHPHINQHYSSLKKLLGALEQHQSIPQVEIAMGDKDIAFVFRHLKPLSEGDTAKLIAFAKASGVHVYLQPNSPANIQKCWPQDDNPRLNYTLPDYDLDFLFHPSDFTQINLEINRLMVNQAITFLELKSEDKVLDLFCGIGNFTLPMARLCSQVTGIEGTLDMVSRAKENALHNQITNTAFYAANLMDVPEKAAWVKARYDKILLDPPRAGAKEILRFIPIWRAKKIVYVSCNPATLARDAGELVHQHGYTLKQAGVMNMFPHTAHIEALAVFEKN